MSGTIFGRQPVYVAAAIRACILAAVAFGLNWTPVQIAGLMFAVEAVLALLTGGAVTPTAAPKLEIGQSVNQGMATVTSVVSDPVVRTDVSAPPTTTTPPA